MPCTPKSVLLRNISTGILCYDQKLVWFVHFAIITFCVCHLPVFPWFKNTCSHILYPVFGFSSVHLWKPSCQLTAPSEIIPRLCLEWAWRDSPVLCWVGCWVTVSLLALCPMLHQLSLLTCRALPPQRPTEGEVNRRHLPFLQPNRSSVTQGRLDNLRCFVSLDSIVFLLPSVWYLISSSQPPSFTHFKTNRHSLACSVFSILWALTS